MNGLLSIELLGILHTEAEEVNELSSRVNLGLPGVLALTVHGQSHDIIAVLGRNEVGGLEENASTLREGSGSPSLARLEGGRNGSLDIGLGGVGVGGDGRVSSRVALSESLGALDLFCVRDIALKIVSAIGIYLLACDHQRHV